MVIRRSPKSNERKQTQYLSIFTMWVTRVGAVQYYA